MGPTCQLCSWSTTAGGWNQLAHGNNKQSTLVHRDGPGMAARHCVHGTRPGMRQQYEAACTCCAQGGVSICLSGCLHVQCSHDNPSVRAQLVHKDGLGVSTRHRMHGVKHQLEVAAPQELLEGGEVSCNLDLSVARQWSRLAVHISDGQSIYCCSISSGKRALPQCRLSRPAVCACCLPTRCMCTALYTQAVLDTVNQFPLQCSE